MSRAADKFMYSCMFGKAKDGGPGAGRVSCRQPVPNRIEQVAELGQRVGQEREREKERGREKEREREGERGREKESKRRRERERERKSERERETERGARRREGETGRVPGGVRSVVRKLGEMP